MKSFLNGEVNVWSEVLTEDSTLRKYLPMSGCQVINNSDDVLKIYLHGGYVGTCQGYSSFSVNNKPFDSFRVELENGEKMVDKTVEVIVSKSEIISSSAFNPQLDFMEDNFDKFALRCNKRMSYDPIDMPYDKMVYILNASAKRIVQRRIDIEGNTSNFGQYKILFDEDDIVSGAIPVGGVFTSEKRYRKTLDNKNLAVTLTDANMRGWIVDYKEKDTVILPGSYVSENFGYGFEHLKVVDYDVDTKGSFPNNYQAGGVNIMRLTKNSGYWEGTGGGYKCEIAGEAGFDYILKCIVQTESDGWQTLFEIYNDTGSNKFFSGGFNCPWPIRQIFCECRHLGGTPTQTLCDIYDISLY